MVDFKHFDEYLHSVIANYWTARAIYAHTRGLAQRDRYIWQAMDCPCGEPLDPKKFRELVKRYLAQYEWYLVSIGHGEKFPVLKGVRE